MPAAATTHPDSRNTGGKEATMATTLTPSERFAAVAFAHGLTYDGPRNLKVSIGHAGQIEGFAHCYPAAEVEAAEALIRAAASGDGVAEAHANFVAVVPA